ncbi:TOPRIM nucleotidyl transferase/hydrolase domain-containing protein [Desulfosporosinus sp. SB140]|uniref:TOPRIM nucleotidyl transferase/hydrolase domain-containing protein n=1 Tax=Desulfosporosinus paludis TaxID=3115649 RepID=UPI00389044BF
MEIEGSPIEKKINAYHYTWYNSIASMYQKYLPNINYENSIGVEFTPFTYFVVSNNIIDFVEVMRLSPNDIEFLNNLYYTYKLKYPNIGRLVSAENFADFMINIVLFPPIMQLYTFYRLAYELHANYMKTLLETFSNIIIEQPPYRTNIGLFYGYHFISQRTYERIGKRHGLLACKELESIRDDLINIDKKCSDAVTLDSTVICPECGMQHDNFTIGKDAIFFTHLTSLYPELLISIGFRYFDDYVRDIEEAITRIIKETPEMLNTVKDAKCIILVEGATEEVAIPQLALKYDRPLAPMKIHVWNSTSKQQVLADFRKIKDNLHDVKICALLDSDANKERIDLERMIKGKKDRYSLKFIEKGTFEDLIPIDYAIKAFNELYNLDKPVKLEDIDQNKEILGQFDRILRNAYAGKLDKVKFIKKAIAYIQKDEIPQLIQELIDDAYKLIGEKTN